ncbi:N-acetylglucosamine-binding protein GbpA [Thalassotalea marina]|uniref:GlcNAc-binding protein A n=1 Tax=Thalassotalea marina TaxID=1673741 RepID=A0A919BAY5_9GAMM|nr:N-acetylglucosamine-binding protein GbpA [Thalassotalea marina]GHF79819.1 GlcNAc-binding protein A [Thalassotalea marina]
MKNLKLTLLSPLMLGMFSIVPNQVAAHGYISKPESRGYLCRLGENQRCGNVVYEPQSIEGRDRFPETGPMDGQIASAGLPVFSPLNAQTISRWTKRPISAGANEFIWTFTAAHSTRDWRYFITKANWDANAPLTRDQFESVPFCSYEGHYKQPPRTLTHLCNVPADRNGYHVILGVWDVGDTPMSFYNVMDVMIDNGDQSEIQWLDVGDINAIHDLKQDDKVIARVFGTSGELTALKTELTITSDEEGSATFWPKLMAQTINANQSWLQAGVLNAENEIVPVDGKNEIFAQSGSGIERVELSYVKAPPPQAEVSIEGVKHHYYIDNDQVAIDFTYDVDMPATVNVTLNSHYNSVVQFTETVEAGTTDFSLVYENAKAGHYNLTIETQAENGSQSQLGFHLNITVNDGTTPPEPGTPDEAEFSFPEGLPQYKAGTVVFQPKTGKLYQCKPWPYNGFCVQYSASANQFEPGVGTDWEMAWRAL